MLISIKPIESTVEAKPHRPVYRMHRYFARRPYTVFANLVSHYSKENEVILDPFCGGGVTLVEGLIQNRRVIGYDVNPLAIFVTKMELEDVDLEKFKIIQKQIMQQFQSINDRIFGTICRKCSKKAVAEWFEYSSLTKCDACKYVFKISTANKVGMGRWQCPNCSTPKRFSPDAKTRSEIINVCYRCNHCDHKEITEPIFSDFESFEKIKKELLIQKNNNLWIPNEKIPDCNMQRESALFKKGIVKFEQLFTERHLLSLGYLHDIITKLDDPLKEWMLFAFSSTIRYTNKMVTRNTSWRGNRPLEWNKPGFWLPSIHLEANVLEEFSRRCIAIIKGKQDYLEKIEKKPQYKKSTLQVLKDKTPSYHVNTRSSTDMNLPDDCIDSIITDPPYGSYVHYADLSNFWSVWLPESKGMGKVIDDSEEAVIARKNFPGAKNVNDYQRILEHCFKECFRVLKSDKYMVLTFHNREPRAWATLLISALKAGFQLSSKGMIFQEGIASYRHTAQSRRSGSVIGDFIFSFYKPSTKSALKPTKTNNAKVNDKEIIKIIKNILIKKGPLSADDLMRYFYVDYIPILLQKIQNALFLGNLAVEELLEDFNSVDLFDSHQRQLLEQHFNYKAEKWSIK